MPTVPVRATEAVAAAPAEASRRGMHDFSEVFNTPLPAAIESRYQEFVRRSHREGDASDYDLRGAYLAAMAGDKRTKWLIDPNAPADERGHLPDDWKKPNHPTFSAQSHYSGPSGFEGGKWSQGKKGGPWTFEASPHNLLFQTARELQQYMHDREPGNTLVLPSDKPKKE